MKSLGEGARPVTGLPTALWPVPRGTRPLQTPPTCPVNADTAPGPAGRVGTHTGPCRSPDCDKNPKRVAAQGPDWILVYDENPSQSSALLAGPQARPWGPGVGRAVRGERRPDVRRGARRTRGAGPPGAGAPADFGDRTAPHVAGAAALYLSGQPSARPDEVAEAVVRWAVPGRVSGGGSGSPDRLSQVNGLQAASRGRSSPVRERLRGLGGGRSPAVRGVRSARPDLCGSIRTSS